MKRGNYKNGKIHGIWEFYNENGILQLKETYDNDILLKKEQF